MPTTTETLPLSGTLAPTDQVGLVDAVRSAADAGRALYPIGGGTMADHGGRPTRRGIGLSMLNLCRLIDYPADDMTITVEAGMTIAELNRRLAARWQWLPVDVPWADRATVGGAIAASAGPRRHAYGALRDYLLGFTAVDGRGAAFSGGGRVVKNAAGYNMTRLMAGSFGTLGLLTQATLMVRPLPEAAALLACEVADFQLAEKLLASLTRSEVRPAAVEFSNGREYNDAAVPAVQAGETPAPQTRGPNPLFGPIHEGKVGRLCVGFEGTEVEVEWMLDRLRGQWAAVGMTSPTLMPRPSSDKLWRWIAEFPADLEINVLPSRLIATIADLLAAVPDVAVEAHAADGIIRVQYCGAGVSPASVRQDAVCSRDGRTTRELVFQIRDLAARHGGKTVVRRHPAGKALTREEVWGPPGPEIRVMRAIKERFDPWNILNPGRFIFD